MTHEVGCNSGKFLEKVLLFSMCLAGCLPLHSGYNVLEIAEWLDHLTLVQRVRSSKPPSDLSLSVRRELARQKGKSNHKVWSYQEEGPGLNWLISFYLISGPFVVST